MTTSSTSSETAKNLGGRVRLFQTSRLPGQPTVTHGGTYDLVMDLFHELRRLKDQEEAVVSVIDNMNVDSHHSIGHWVRQFDEAMSRAGSDHEDLRTEEQKRDEEMVDDFAHAMKLKLSKKRAEGRGGWWDPECCSGRDLAAMLVEHLIKGNEGSFVDVANFTAMLYARNDSEQVMADAVSSYVKGILANSAPRPTIDERVPEEQHEDTYLLSVDALDYLFHRAGAPSDGIMLKDFGGRWNERTAKDAVLKQLKGNEERFLKYKGHYDNALGMIRMRGVPESRARTLTQALDVILTRLDREVRTRGVECEQLAIQLCEIKSERTDLIRENEKLIAELSEAKKEVTDSEFRLSDKGHSIEHWAEDWVKEHGAPTITHREAIESTLQFVDEKVKHRSCDSESISSCWRCQMVYLANVLREVLRASDRKGTTVNVVNEGQAIETSTEVQRLRRVAIDAGLCPDCGCIPEMDEEGPFSHCRCGTGEDNGTRPMQAIQLNNRRNAEGREERDDGEKCDACGKRYPTIYRVPDDVWSKIAPLGEEESQFGGLLCVDCAWQRAKEQGVTLYFEGVKDWWPWEAVDIDYDMSIHSNPDHTEWASFFLRTYPNCGADHETMSAWFANAMMAKADSMSQEGPPPWPSPVEEILHELDKARKKFPMWPTDIIHAAMVVQEEAGELGQAALQSTYEAGKATLDDAYGEAIQTAAMAIRFMQNMPRYKVVCPVQHRDDVHGDIDNLLTALAEDVDGMSDEEVIAESEPGDLEDARSVVESATITFEPIPDYCDLMVYGELGDDIPEGTSLFDFNFFNADDGSGYWATINAMSRLSVFSYPKPSWATHVAWFNK